MGGALLTIRFDIEDAKPLLDILRDTADITRICGAHICQGDRESSEVRTTETKGRTDIQEPPSWFLMVEATGPAVLEPLLPNSQLAAAGATHMLRGLYGLEYVRGKTAWT
jgi:hypothetical protein